MSIRRTSYVALRSRGILIRRVHDRFILFGGMSDKAHSVTIWCCFSEATVTTCARRKVGRASRREEFASTRFRSESGEIARNERRAGCSRNLVDAYQCRLEFSLRISRDRRRSALDRSTRNRKRAEFPQSVLPFPYLGKAVVSGLRVDNNRSEITGVRTRNDRD